jgi:hypothetical protein
MNITMKSLLAATAAISLVACVKQDAPPDAISRALPTADQVSIKLPVASNRTIGDLAEWYVATRNVTLMFNGGTAWVLVLLHAIVQYPVTSISGDTYTWGPFSNALDPAEYKLDVKDMGDGTYQYTFSGRSKTQANSTFEVVIDGVADPRKGDLQGNGKFLLDFDAGRRVNPIDGDPNARGQVEVNYDLAQRHLGLTIMTTDSAGKLVSADYAYNETADGGGDMVFDVDGDAGGGAALESITLRSRWLSTGIGRADARITGGDAGTGVTASECWDKQFARVFYQDSLGFSPTEGKVSDCAFATADLPPAH